MKRNNHKLKRGIILVLLSSFGITSFGQLPTDYDTKVSYHEQKTVSYSVPNMIDLKCLTLSELSRYHGYMQFYSMDEYIDEEGDLLTDQKFIDEENVRDDWMEGYSRITIGKNTVDVYGKESGLLLQKPKDHSDENVFLSPQQAQNYGLLVLDDIYYVNLVADLSSLDLTVTDENNMVIASNEEVSIGFDNNSKVATVIEYNEDGLKTKESVIEYEINTEGDTYYVRKKTVIEWFFGENGCCIRKITVIDRFEYTREVFYTSPERRDNSSKNSIEQGIETSDIQILTEKNRDIFRISSKTYSKKELEIKVYNMAGKQVLHAKVQEGEAIHLPRSSRAGMYLVHIMSKNRNTPVVGKVIKCDSGNQF